MLESYKPSGKFDVSSLFFIVITSLILMPILGIAYTYAVWYIPIIYFNIALTGIFGFAIGWLIKMIVVKKGKVRSVKIAILFTIIGATAAYYFHWIIWVDLVMNSGEIIGDSNLGIVVSNIKVNQVINLISDPDFVWNFIQKMNDYGTWGFKSNTVSGGFLTAIWIAEFIIIFSVAIIYAIPSASEPFSEDNNQWLKLQKLPHLTALEDVQGFINAINSNNLTPIKELELEKDASKSYCEITFYGSDIGKKYVNISQNIANRNSKGEIDFSTNYLFEKTLIDEPFYHLLQQKKNASEMSPSKTYT